jgi:hypothetical protein
MFISQLTESVSSVVYHFTRLFNAAEILKNNQFRLTASPGTDSERALQKGNKPYYLSTTRSRVGDYTLHNFYTDGVVFVLNGDWFNERYRGGPVDYWAGSKLQSNDTGLKGRYKEMEDRVFSDEAYIAFPKDPKRLIKAVHILFKKDSDTRRNQSMRTILTRVKQMGIPHYVYDDDAAFVLQDTRKAIPVDSAFIAQISQQDPNKPWPARQPTDWLKGWREIYYAKDKDSLTKDGKRTADKVMHYAKDAYSGLSADIHNVKAKGDPGLIKLIKIFRKMGINNSRQYVDAMRAKWEPIYKKAEEDYWADIKKKREQEEAGSA